VDNGPVWVGAGPKCPTGPIHGWNFIAHTDPKLSYGLYGFGSNGFAGSRMDLCGFRTTSSTRTWSEHSE
jgi:hypothetical protein